MPGALWAPGILTPFHFGSPVSKSSRFYFIVNAPAAPRPLHWP